MPTYRTATLADLPACAELEWTRSRDDLAWHVAAELIYVAIESPGESIDDGGTVVGYLRLESFWNAMPYLALIVVREGYRRRGIGSALLEHTCSELRNRGYGSLLSSTTAGESAPHDWHRRNGFVDVGALRALNDANVDELFLRRIL